MLLSPDDLEESESAEVALPVDHEPLEFCEGECGLGNELSRLSSSEGLFSSSEMSICINEGFLSDLLSFSDFFFLELFVLLVVKLLKNIIFERIRANDPLQQSLDNCKVTFLSSHSNVIVPLKELSQRNKSVNTESSANVPRPRHTHPSFFDDTFMSNVK